MTPEALPRLVAGSTPARVYGEIWYHGPVSRTDLVELTGMTKSTIFVVTEELAAAGLITESGLRDSGARGGRRAALLSADPAAHLVAGAHVGVNKTTIAVADALGRILDSRVVPTQRRSPEVMLGQVADLVVELAEAHGGRSRVGAVGVVLPGLVDRHSGVCVLAPNLGWRQVACAELLSARLEAPVFVHNTVQAMAVAEMAQLRTERTTLAMLYVGTGVGAAVVTDDLLVCGSAGLAGEIGHLVVPGGAERCACGRTGCLETLVSGPAIVRRARALGLRSPDGRALTPAGVGELARAGDGAARDLIAAVGSDLGLAARILVQLTNPATLVLSGSVSELGELLLGPVRESVEGECQPELTQELVIRRSLLDADGTLRGALTIALQGLGVPVRGLARLQAAR